MVAFFASNILLALKCLHENNIIYRDLKPENVLINEKGYALLTDFGLSKENITNQDKTSSLCGTPDYLAPEQVNFNSKSRSYGKEVDWWSFGCIVYEMLTGCPPFMSDSNEKTYD